MKKIRLIGIVIVAILATCGCGIDSMPELTDDESAIITEYAAGLLLKYSKNYDYKIVDDIEVLAYEDEEETQETEETQSQEQESEIDETETQLDTSESDIESHEIVETQTGTGDLPDTVANDTDLADALGIDGVSIKYAGNYEIYDSYPKTSTGFSVSANQGSKILVVFFKLGNKSVADGNINLMDYSISATANINGERTVKSLSTLLPNDMISYYGNIKQGNSDEVVLLFQISSDLAENQMQINLKLSAGGNSVNINLE